MTRNERRIAKRYNAERDAALVEGTVDAILAVARKWRIRMPDTEEATEIMIHKLRLHTNMPPDLVNVSRGWLALHGCDEEVWR